MIFDQYQRYKTVEIIVDMARSYLQKERFTILEIGANEQCNLEMVLPEDDIEYSDVVLNDVMKHDRRFIQLDGCHMPEIADGKYDIVIALDVFEHIKEEQRENFLIEVKRVAKYITLVCFPFKSIYNESAEKRVNSYYKMIFNCDHPWLIEHIQNGLPLVEQVIQILEERHIPYEDFYHGDIFLWEEMMKALFTVYGLQNGGYYFEEMDRLYEEQMYYNDRSKYPYRVFMLLSENVEFLQEIRKQLEKKFTEDQVQEAGKLLLRCIDDIKYRLVSEQGRRISVQHQVYYSFDGSFSESQKWVHFSESLDANIIRVCWKIEIDNNYTALRFDPVEEENCIVKNLMIESNIGELDFEIINGVYDNNRIIFCEEDPQIYINLQNESEIEWICIHADIMRADFPEAVIRYPIGRKIDSLGANLLESIDRNSNDLARVQDLLAMYIQRQNEINDNLSKSNELLDITTRQCEELHVQLLASVERERDIQNEKEGWKVHSQQLENQKKQLEEEFCCLEERRRQLEEQCCRMEERNGQLEEQYCRMEEQNRQWEELSRHWEARCIKMEGTISWRITAILRKAGKLLQRKEG